MSAIDDKYLALLPTLPWLGEPDGDEKACDDGVGRYREYRGGASIYWTPSTGAHVLYGHIRAKWIALGREKGPNGYPTSDETEAASGKGRQSTFQQGVIAYRRNTFEAFSVHGKIFTKWSALQKDAGPLGFPLTDERPTQGNAGRFSEFERGAIYWRADLGAHVVRTPVLEAWGLANREKGIHGFPTADTPATKDAQGAYVQPFEGGRISCSEGASRSLVTSTLLTTHIEPISRALKIFPTPETAEAWKLPGISDTRLCPVMRLNRHFRLNTAVVIFRGSYTRTLGDPEIQSLKDAYQEAQSRVGQFNFDLAALHPTYFVVEQTLAKSDFTNYHPAEHPGTFAAEFAAYAKVRDALLAQGADVDDFDVISVCVPWVDTASDKASGFAWANGPAKFGGNTYSSIHYIYPPAAGKRYWWAYFVHETTHCVEWMLEGHGFMDLRNNDDSWWGACYPTLTSSTVTPTPENVVTAADPNDPRLYAMHQRIKGAWFGLSPTWGSVTTQRSTLEDYGKILTYTSPDVRTIVETAWTVRYLGLPSVADCQAIGAELQALAAEKKSLQAELARAAPARKAALTSSIKKINEKVAALNKSSAICAAKAALLER